MVLYGQIIVGAPGAGKTTYCDGMQQYLKLLGRDCHVVNLDPANETPPVPDNGNGTATANDDGNCNENQLQEGEGDDGNPQLPYDTILDVCQDIISLDSVMSELDLGPNGGLLYCMEYIERHLGEVIKLLKERLGIPAAGSTQHHSSRAYLLFDLPGQIELTAHSNVIPRIAQRLVRELDLRLVCVQLVDAALCLTDVSKFIGASLVCTASMMRLELPCVNVLTKMDLLQSSCDYGKCGITKKDETKKDESDNDSDFGYDDGFGASPLPFHLEFFTQCHDLHRLVDYLDSNPLEVDAESNFQNYEADADPLLDYREDPEYQKAQQRTRSSAFFRKYRKLHKELCDTVEDYGLLSFLPLSIEDAESVGRVLARVDKCNGYVFLESCSDRRAENGGRKGHMQDMFSSAMAADSEWEGGILSDIQEKYLGEAVFREDISELSWRPSHRIEKEKMKEKVEIS